MTHNDFQENYDFGVKHYRSLLEVFYRYYCYDGRFVHMDNSFFSDLIQQRLKTDTVIQKEAEVSYGIEEKIVSWPKEKETPHTAFFLETRSCTNPGHESDGWMVTCKADKLLYAFEIKDLGLVAYLMDFPQLKQWFWERYLPHLPRPDYGRFVMTDKNCTEGRVVALATVVKQIPTECFLLTFDGKCKRLRPDVDIQRLRETYVQAGKDRRMVVLSPEEENREEEEQET